MTEGQKTRVKSPQKVECRNPLPDIDVIIGLDIIKYCDFSISNDGKGNCTCSIRFPSQGVIDYTK